LTSWLTSCRPHRLSFRCLKARDAIARNREVMGATNPAEAEDGTIRKEFAESIGENSVHGSDAPETAAKEIAYWFSELEIVG
jgi:nucleoside-diphosphate kinase